MAGKRYKNGSIYKIKKERSVRFQAYIRHDKKTIKRNFPTEHQAKAFIDSFEPLANASLGSLNSPDMMDAARARLILPEKYTLVEAVKGFLDGQATIEPLSPTMGIERFLSQKKKAGRSTKTLATYRAHLSRLMSLPMPIHEITKADLEGTIKDSDSQTYRANLFRDYKIFLKWAVENSHANENVAEKLEKPTVIRKLAEVFTNDQVVSLLYVASEIDQSIAAEYAIGFFAGIRPEELSKLRWKHVGPDRIHIPPEIAKTRQQRFVDIHPVLEEWLRGKRGKDSDRVCKGEKFKRQTVAKAIKKTAGLKTWPKDGLRHTFASNHLAHFRNAGETSIQLGHIRNRDMLFDHYRNLIGREDAAAFWRLSPEKVFHDFSPEIKEATKRLKMKGVKFIRKPRKKKSL